MYKRQTLVHVSFAESVQDALGGANSKLSESSKELMLGDMLVLSDVEVLEHRLKVDSLDSDGLSVLFKDVVDLSLLLGGDVEVLSSSWNCGFDGYWSNRCRWLLLNAISGEDTVDIVAELMVVDHVLSIS